MTSRAARGARSPRSHYDIILIVTSFATELATPTVMDVRTHTLPRLLYKDSNAVPGNITKANLRQFHNPATACR